MWLALFPTLDAEDSGPTCTSTHNRSPRDGDSAEVAWDGAMEHTWAGRGPRRSSSQERPLRRRRLSEAGWIEAAIGSVCWAVGGTPGKQNIQCKGPEAGNFPASTKDNKEANEVAAETAKGQVGGTKFSGRAWTDHWRGLRAVEGHQNVMSYLCSKSEHDGSPWEELEQR